MTDVSGLTRTSGWDGVRVVVVGGPRLDAASFAAADNLNHLGADVVALAESASAADLERAELLEVLGARVEIHTGATTRLPEPASVDLLVVGPAVDDDHPLLAEAAAHGIAVWGELELAWRLRPHVPEGPEAPWLCLTGTVDADLAAALLGRILRAAGLQPVLAGADLLPVVEAVMDPEPYDAFVLVLSPEQLRRPGSMSPGSAVVLGTAGADDPRTALLGRVYERTRVACVYLASDPAAEDLVREADVVEGARAIGVSLGTPAVGMLGVVEELLVDRAFIEERASSAAELATLSDLAGLSTPGGPADGVPEVRLVTAALAAAAIARAHGVPQVAVRDGLRATPS